MIRRIQHSHTLCQVYNRDSFKVDAQWIAMNGKEIPLQEEKVKGAAYAENSSVIEQPIL